MARTQDSESAYRNSPMEHLRVGQTFLRCYFASQSCVQVLIEAVTVAIKLKLGSVKTYSSNAGLYHKGANW